MGELEALPASVDSTKPLRSKYELWNLFNSVMRWIAGTDTPISKTVPHKPWETFFFFFYFLTTFLICHVHSYLTTTIAFP